MRKLLKLMFSQITIVSFLLILQLLAMAASLMRISEYFVYFNIFLRLVSIVTVVIIINRHSNPSYKLAWVVPILMFPLFGGLFYLFITGQMHTKYYFFKLGAMEKSINRRYRQDSEVLGEIAEKFPERKTTVRYINNVSGMNAYRCTAAEYFPLGEDMHRSILKELENASRYIFIEFFKYCYFIGTVVIDVQCVGYCLDIELLQTFSITRVYAIRHTEVDGIFAANFIPFKFTHTVIW